MKGPTLALALLGAVASTAAAAELVRHSGTVVAVDRQKGVLVVGEIGPWEVRDGETVVIRRTIGITEATQFIEVARDEAAPSGFAGDFVERPRDPWAVRPGDFVTVEVRRDGPQKVAERVVRVVVDSPR